MKLLLITNALTEQDYLDLCQGLQNTMLCDDGRRQCKKLADKLKNKKFDYCYMSPLIRCVETAIILIGDRVQTIPDKRIIERDLGDFVGMPKNNFDLNKYWDYGTNTKDRSVEGIRDYVKRCESFLEYIKEKHKNHNILIVSHPSTIMILRVLILHQKLNSNLWNQKIGNLYYEELEMD